MEPRDILKKLHPNQFSDSKTIDKVECPKELVDFYLSRLSEHNKHFDFEQFIKRLLEREVCPNLVEETGPAGGGDGKVDTDTFPVSLKIQKFWWYGINEKNDRWAFAISLKKSWKSKCDGDIKKIIDTKRGYSKIFFITNQPIKNDKRLEYQDQKKKETGIDIIILDKSWILDKVLNDKNIDLLKTLGITQIIKEKQIGINDLEKQRKLENIEKKLQDYSLKGIVNQDVIDLSIESAILSRDLEESEIIVTGKFQRALRFCKEKKNKIDERNIIYDLAWYYHWWLNDDINFEKYYEEFQNEVNKDKNIEDILKLANLWTLAYTRKDRNIEEVKDKTNILLNLLEEKKKSLSRVTQLEAMTRICIIKILLESNVEKQFEKLISIVNEAIKFKEYDFMSLAKMIEIMLPIFNDNEKFNYLYDLITEKLASRHGEIQRAEMYLKKAKMLTSNSQYYNAINILGKCLTLLYKDETSGKLLEVYINIGANFESIGLLYVAKNYYIAAVTMFMEFFLKESVLDPFVIKIINKIIDLEIHLGNIEEILEWFSIKNIFLVLLTDKDDQIDFKEENEYLLQRDALISSEILSTKLSDFKIINKIIYECKINGLVTAETMAKYVIGEYDNELLNECNNNKVKFDELISDFYRESLSQCLPMPVYFNNEENEIQSLLNGNKIKIKYTASKLMHRFAEFTMAIIENTFATIHSYKVYMRGDIIINLKNGDGDNFDLNYSFDGIDTYTIVIDSIENYDISVDSHKLITDMLYKLLTNILAVNFIYSDYKKTIKNMFDDDKTFERSLNHTNSLYNLNKIFGNDDNKDIPTFNITRDSEWYLGLELDILKEDTVDPFEGTEKIIYGEPQKNLFENISHSNIYSSDIIKCSHWDAAIWKGIIYLGDIQNKSFIKIGFLFENEIGAKKVFQDLIDSATKEDKDGKIIVSFIKGIDRNKIYNYRVMITGKVKIPKNYNENIIISNPARFHQMECEDNKNIKILEDVINSKKNPKITIFPMIYKDNYNMHPLWEYEIKLNKVNIKYAYEIGIGDLESAAILKYDNPIIPQEIKDAPIVKLLDLKKSIY